jgi:peptidoglycan/xylan/chitin deacetylase (PgdA/CDA1 family)
MRSQPIVLMYHGIKENGPALPDGREEGAELYDVSLKKFKAQMQFLKSRQFDVTLLKDILSKNSVILTFDDGEINNCTHALPVLQGLDFPAYFFVIAKRVGHDGYMGWKELRQLHDAGMVIGSHGLSHEILTPLKDTQIEEELQVSKKYIERNLDITVNSLSIPRGFCNDKIIQMARAAGYADIFISDRPKSLTMPCFTRVAVKGNWPIKRFEQALAGKIPSNEKMFNLCKNGIKRLGRETLYDWMRTVLLRIK